MIPAALLLALAAGPAAGQERLGAAVALTPDGEVAVLKPGALRGPAGVLLFRSDGAGGWSRTARLPALPGAFPGERLTPSLAVGGDRLVMGGGDPDGAVAGHLYVAGPDGWVAAGRVPVDPAVEPATGLPAAGLDMATLMRLMEPAGRTVALSPDGSLLAVAGGGVEAGVVHLLRREDGGAGGEGRWVLEAVVRAEAEGWEETGGDGRRDASRAGAGGAMPTRDPQFGAALALDGNRLLVGAPDARPGGRAYLFERTGGTWRQVAVVSSRAGEEDGRLGQAVALHGDRAWVGAPRLGQVVRLAPGPDGAWTRIGVLRPDGSEAIGATAFGAALATAEGRLWVGAPTAEQGRGVVYRYVAAPAGPGEAGGEGGWTAQEPLAPTDRGERDGFGAALALSADRGAVGAPGADGGRGRAAVVELAGATAGRSVAGGRAATEDLGAADRLTWLDPELGLERVVGEEVRCREGEAAAFSCQGVDLLAFLPLAELGAGPGEQVSDMWGWTDPETGREYALVGRTAGLAFVDVTDPVRPRFVGLMKANPSHARDIKVYRDHAFMTGDGAGDHGLLVFDLTRLRDVAPELDPAQTIFEPDARYDRVASAHNLVLDTESGFAYTVGTNTGGESCGGGLHMIDVRDPLEPRFAGCYTDSEGLIWSGRTHDAQCTVYRGPDEPYRGRQICFASNETALRIVDVTDKEAPVPLASASHPGTAYVHQAWLTDDHRYLYVNDELDEIVGTTDRTRTLVWDVQELEDPILVAEHLGPDQATDHNLFIRGDRAYLANYQAGVRVLDVSDPERPVEIGWFDTTPYGANPPGFLGGAWTAWPFFESGTVVATSMNEGLFLLRPRPAVIP